MMAVLYCPFLIRAAEHVNLDEGGHGNLVLYCILLCQIDPPLYKLQELGEVLVKHSCVDVVHITCLALRPHPLISPTAIFVRSYTPAGLQVESYRVASLLAYQSH